MPEYQFDHDGPLQVEVVLPTGDVRVTGAEGGSGAEVSVTPRKPGDEDYAAETTVELVGSRLRIEAPQRRFGRTPRLIVHVTVPAGSDVGTRTASADVAFHGRLGSLDVNGASTDVTAEAVDGDVQVKLASGDVTVGDVGGALRVKTASGDLIARSAGEVEFKAASGHAKLGSVSGGVTVKTASGNISVAEAWTGVYDLNTTSGNVAVGVRAGTLLKLDLTTHSGRVDSELPVDDTPPAAGAHLDLHARSTSGNIRLSRAATSHEGS